MKLCVALCVFTTVLDSCSGACYFSPEMQGEYVMQSTTSQGQYSKVKVMDDNIPIWGQCHHRIGNNVILTDRYNIEEDCIRCFHLKLLSRNILQVRTEGLDKCYTNEKAAEASCDNQDGFKTIILYKTKELAGEEITKAYCPINGRFSFVYNVNDGSENNVECSRPLSELDDCPKRSSSALNLRFRGCSFDNHDIKFECLGDWEGPDNQHYLALLDTRQQGEQRPQYRCALYKEDEHTGNIFMAFSSDSTCTTNLHSATSGFETLNLTAVDKTEWPPEVSSSNCRFQPWAQGKWEHMIVNENTVLYKDHSTYKTLTVRCVNEDSFNAERMIVYIQSTCGEEMYTCIWVKQRSKNVLEFQIGTKSSTSYDNSLCMDFNFQNKVWLTQGRLDRSQESPCPIRGEYTGFIPDTTEACAKLASDTKFPEIMYYTVSDCKQQEIYEGHFHQHHWMLRKRDTGSDSKIYRIVNPLTATTSLATDSTTLSTTSAGSVKHTEGTNSSEILGVSENHNVSSYTTPDITTPFYSLVTDNSSNGGDKNGENNYKENNFSNNENSSPTFHNDSVATASVTSTVFNEENASDQFRPLFEITTTSNDHMQPTRPSRESISYPDIYYNRNTDNYNEFHKLSPPREYFTSDTPVQTSTWNYYNYNTKTNGFDNSRTNYYNNRGSSETSYGYRDQYTNDKFYRRFPTSVSDIPQSTVGMTYNRRPWGSPSGYNPYFRNSDQHPEPSSTPYHAFSHTPIIYHNQYLGTQGYMNRGNWDYTTHNKNWNSQVSGGRIFVTEALSTSQFRNANPNRRIPVALPPIQLPPSYVPPRLGQSISSASPIFIGTRKQVPSPSASSESGAPTVREEREYRCLGQWEEEGLTYTYTQRKDIGTYECFVGSIISNNEIYIKEAGKHCERDIDPLKYGMKLLRKGTQEGMTMAPGSQRPIDRFTGRFPSSTKPWNPIAGTQEGMTGSPDSQRPMDRFTTSRSPPTKPWKPITAPPSQSIACTAKLTVVTVIITLYSLFMLC